MDTLMSFIVGLVVTILLGLCVGPILKRVKQAEPLPPPSEALAEKWKIVTKGDATGSMLGHLERFAFFGAFWVDALLFAPAWFAFKVASKWNVWSNVISVPKSIDGVDEVDYLIARRRWGSQVLMSFLIGTLLNVVIGFIGAAVGMHSIGVFEVVWTTVSSAL